MSKHETLGIYDYQQHKLCDLYDSQIDLVGQAYSIVVTEENNGNHTLEFSIPYMALPNGNDQMANGDRYGTGVYGRSRYGTGGASRVNRNFRWDFLRSDYLIRYTCDDRTVWYVASKPSKAKSGKKIYGNVTCNGTESLLKTKNIYLTFDDENGIGTAPELLVKILAGTGWSFDDAHSDTLYETDTEVEKVRSLKSDGKQGALGLITTTCNLFQCRPVFDTDKQTLTIKSLKNRQQVLEGEVGRNLSALTVNHDSSNIATRVYIEGEYGDYGYVGIDDVKVDAEGNPDESGEAYGLSFMMNFDYYREIGVFTAAHEAALQTYLTAIRAKKSQIRSNADLLISVQDQLNTMIGQCKMALYYYDTDVTPHTGSLVTPMYVYGAITDAQAALNLDDDVVILLKNGKHKYEKWLNSPGTQMIGAYGVAKFATPSSGKIGADEVAIEAKEKNIANLEKRVEASYGKESKIAEYKAEILQAKKEIEAIYTGYTAYDEMAAYAVGDQCSHNTGYDTEGYTYVTANAYKCTTAISEHSEAHEWDALEWAQDNLGGLCERMYSVMNAEGLLYQLAYYQGIADQLDDDQDDIEATFIAAMGYLLRDGYWSNQNYVVGQEEYLYRDGMDMTREMSHPTTDYTFSYVRITEDFGIPAEEIEINAIFKLYDSELGIDDSMFVKKISVGVDDRSLGQIEVSNQDITLTGGDLGSLLSRMSQLADLIEAKNAMYERAKSLTSEGTLYTDRLQGAIDATTTQILSTVSNWYTDERGNMVFLSGDGGSAMMLSGAGFLCANSKNDAGEWNWRTAIDGAGIVADEIIAGFISAARIEAGSITTNHLASEVGENLDLSSNTSITMRIETEVYPTVDSMFGYKLEIISTTDVLSADTTSTTLTARVWHGSQNVTASMAASRFNWKRHTDDAAADTAWNNDSSHQGTKSITLTCADVDYSATYECELLSEEGT